MCRVLEVSTSGYYAWRNRPERAPTVRCLRTCVASMASIMAATAAPGYAALRAEGRTASRGRVARLMRRHGIRALAGRRFRPCTTDSCHYLPIAHRAEPGEAGVHGVGAEPHLVGRHHFHRNRGRMAESRRSARPGDPQERRLVHTRPYAHRTAAGCNADGRTAATAGRRPHLSIRLGQPHPRHTASNSPP